MVQVREWKLQALTDIWTGDARRGSDRLIPTGIMGSLRWWYEVLVRGLDGEACDPTANRVRCPDQDGKHCVVCELFGCTGWARKFRLMVVDESGEVIREQIKANQKFILRFISLRPIRDEEWCLLDLTLRLITEYGAIGGKTVFKPSDEPGQADAFYHKDFGLLSVEEFPNDLASCTREQLEKYVRQGRWRRVGHDDFAWASLKNFWCVKGRYLTRQDVTHSTFNQVVGRKQDKSIKEQHGRRVIRWSDLLENRNDNASRWLAGRQQESKKVFSFREPEENQRTFGFTKPGLVDFDEMKRRLGQVWQDFNPDEEFLTGEYILGQLFQTGGEA